MLILKKNTTFSGIDFASFSDFSLIFVKCSDSLVFFVFQFIKFIALSQPILIFHKMHVTFV